MTMLTATITRCLLLADAAAQDAAQVDNTGTGMMQWLLLMGAMFAIAYFLLMRPQQKREAQHRKMIDELKKNDRVMTVGGIIGTVANVNRDKGVVTVKLNDTTSVQFSSSAIARLLGDESDEKDKG